MRRPLVAALLGSTLLVGARAARAYCYKTTCDKVYACDGEPPPEGCSILHWGSPCMSFSVQEDGGAGIDLETLATVANRAFDTWRTADCGGAAPGFFALNLGPVECDEVEYNEDAGNANIIIMRTGSWPHPKAEYNLALTTTQYNVETGELRNADIELNGGEFEFTVGNDAVASDLASVLTHEVGHFLGMGHSDVAGATMTELYGGGTTTLRTLEADDVAGICALYPPHGAAVSMCDPFPKQGFSPHCRDQQPDEPEGGCGVAPAPVGSGTVLSLLACAAWVTRRRPSSRRRAILLDRPITQTAALLCYSRSRRKPAPCSRLELSQ